jgi:hypothetical protein
VADGENSMSSGISYPIPAHLIPLNIAFVFVVIYSMLTGTAYANAGKRVMELDPSIKTMRSVVDLGSFKPPAPGLKMLLGCAPDLDYPFEVIPEYIISCGPILRPPDEDMAGELGQWIRRNKTVYVNLGTALAVSPAEAMEMARALKKLLVEAQARTGRSEMQVLWKLKRKGGSDKAWEEVEDVLRTAIDQDVVRIVNWIDSEPLSILLSGSVVCMVNHGGANSFWEALW